jgi:hypothetical protein
VDPLREYNISFVGLKPGEHRFEYKIDRRFFEQFPDSIVKDCDIKVELKLTWNNPATVASGR